MWKEVFGKVSVELCVRDRGWFWVKRDNTVVQRLVRKLYFRQFGFNWGERRGFYLGDDVSKFGEIF